MGIIAIGQFGADRQYLPVRDRVFCLGQFTVAVYTLAQFAMASSAIAQIGLVMDKGYGQLIYHFTDIIGRF